MNTTKYEFPLHSEQLQGINAIKRTYNSRTTALERSVVNLDKSLYAICDCCTMWRGWGWGGGGGVVNAALQTEVLYIHRFSKADICLFLSSVFPKATIYIITKTRLFKYTENFSTKKWKISDKKFWYFSYFCSKHRLWVLVRTASMRRF